MKVLLLASLLGAGNLAMPDGGWLVVRTPPLRYSPCWNDPERGWTPSDVSFPPGTGFYIQCVDTDAGATWRVQVLDESRAVILRPDGGVMR